MNHAKLNSAMPQQSMLPLFDGLEDDDGNAPVQVLRGAAVATSSTCDRFPQGDPGCSSQRLPVSAAVAHLMVTKAQSTTVSEVLSSSGELDADDPNSQAYRYKDTGYIAGARKEEAASMVIQRARKEGQRVHASEIDWEDLERNPREARTLITKSNLFGEVDWAALRENGMEPGAAFIVDRIYAAMGQEPSEDNPKARHDYAIGLQALRDQLEAKKTAAQVAEVIELLRQEYEGVKFDAQEKAEYDTLTEQSTALQRELRAHRDVVDKAYKAMQDAQCDVSVARREIESRQRRKWAVKPEHEQALAEATAVLDARSTEWSDAVCGPGKDGRELEKAWSDLHQKKDVIVLRAKARNRAENPLHRAWNLMGERFMKVLFYRYNRGSDAFGKHMTAAKNGKIRDWEWLDKEVMRAPRVTTESVRFQIKVADEYERVGGRQVVPESTAQLKELFGLRDVQSGNWVLRDFASSKFHVEHCAAAFADLADLLGIADRCISHGGRLAMAFGARGQGAKGSKEGAPRAHFETVHRVVNLTKMGGGGALGHEWFHSLDNLVAEMATGKPGGVEDFVTRNPELLPAGELRDAVEALRHAMLDGELQSTKTLSYSAQDFNQLKHVFSGTYVSQTALGIKYAGNVHDAIQLVEKLHGPKPDKRFAGRAKRNYENWRQIAVAHFGGNAEGGEIDVRSGPKMSSFALEALKLDQDGKQCYYGDIIEMAARAFQSWTEDRLAGQGRRNDYLSVYANNKYCVCGLTGMEWKPYPEGEERKRINAAFDRLVEAVRAVLAG